LVRTTYKKKYHQCRGTAADVRTCAVSAYIAPRDTGAYMTPRYTVPIRQEGAHMLPGRVVGIPRARGYRVVIPRRSLRQSHPCTAPLHPYAPLHWVITADDKRSNLERDTQGGRVREERSPSLSHLHPPIRAARRYHNQQTTHDPRDVSHSAT
jgi:hypothetical protein